jgi:hypothetical protein
VSDMQVVYVGQPLPAPEPYYDHDEDESLTIRWSSIFLAGPTPRDKGVSSWRPDAIRMLREMGFYGHVFVPETADGGWLGDYAAQVRWEWSALGLASKTVFWVPRELQTMPGFTTNIEFGIMMAKYPDRVILGCPDDAPKTRYLKMMVEEQAAFSQAFKTPREKVPMVNSLLASLALAVKTC